MSRIFARSVKLATFEREEGRCQICGCKVITAEYDHIVPWALSEDSSASNCQLTCVRCHRAKTSDEDVPRISKAKRVYEKRAGVRRTKRPFQKHVNPWGRERET
jgi:5-methylcytosine-specific restriction enzyme A